MAEVRGCFPAKEGLSLFTGITLKGDGPTQQVQLLCSIKGRIHEFLSDMEKTSQSHGSAAKIIYLRQPDSLQDIAPDQVRHAQTLHLCTLEFIDQLLDEHFK